ncbi:MAG: hypothetical protein JXA43_01465 [Candidatus Diapherotrites archaeon]|nr:hypothetical protein [Candidatus Diapherotrites archaeon]
MGRKMNQALTEHSELWPTEVIEKLHEIELAKGDLELIERGLDPATDFENTSVTLSQEEMAPYKLAYFEYLGEMELQAATEFHNVGNESKAKEFLESSQLWTKEYFKLIFNERLDCLRMDLKEIEPWDYEARIKIWDEIGSLAEQTAVELIARGDSPFSEERIWNRIRNAKGKSKDKIKSLRRRLKSQTKKGKKNKPYLNHRKWEYNKNYK